MASTISSGSAAKTFKLALIQLSVGINKAANLSRATQKVEEAAQNGAQVRTTMDFFAEFEWGSF